MKRCQRAGLLVWGLCLFVLAAQAFAEKRGVGVKEGPAATAYVAAQYGTSWAVVIGVNEYQHHPRVPKLQYAVNDAVAIERALLARGFQKEHIIKLLDREATKNRIEKVLGDELRQKVGQNDRVLVFFAGHGKTDRTRSGEEEGYLMPVDGDPSNLFSTAISMSALRQISDRLVAKHILYVVDSCYSGYALFHRAITDDLLEEMVKKPAIQILTAGRQQDQAQERAGHGVFTDVLLRGLDGDAFPNKGWLSLQELGVYVQQRVYAESNKKQLPQFGNLSGEGQFVFVKGGVDTAKLERPSASTGLSAGPPPPKDVDVSGYDDLDHVAKLAEKREQAWTKVQGFAEKTTVSREKRLAALDKFLQDFADDNPHQGEVEALKQQIQQEIQVANVPTPSLPRQTGREITGRDGAPMVLVPEGEFQYGDNNQRLSLSAFYMDKFEVSTAQYAKYMGEAGAKAPEYWPTSVLVSNGQKPVVGVSWHEAEAYCRYYGKRLPTEQEWEKAARGTDGRTYPWGNEEPTSRHANFNRGSDFQNYGVLVNVGSLEEGKSPYGIYDLAGNVWEWTSSDYDSSRKVVRGGSWDNAAYWLRATNRLWFTPTGRYTNVGFRCAQDAS